MIYNIKECYNVHVTQSILGVESPSKYKPTFECESDIGAVPDQIPTGEQLGQADLLRPDQISNTVVVDALCREPQVRDRVDPQHVLLEDPPHDHVQHLPLGLTAHRDRPDQDLTWLGLTEGKIELLIIYKLYIM